eukprot:COSAG05_NODE_39_length_27555_cov_750.282925_6_plen_186_part_00
MDPPPVLSLLPRSARKPHGWRGRRNAQHAARTMNDAAAAAIPPPTHLWRRGWPVAAPRSAYAAALPSAPAAADERQTRQMTAPPASCRAARPGGFVRGRGAVLLWRLLPPRRHIRRIEPRRPAAPPRRPAAAPRCWASCGMFSRQGTPLVTKPDGRHGHGPKGCPASMRGWHPHSRVYAVRVPYS